MTHPLADISRHDLQLLVEGRLARANFADFVKYIWSVHHPRSPLVWGWYLDAMCEHLQALGNRQITRLLITLPPGLGKSLLVSVYWAAWLWAREPWTRILACSSADNVVYRDARRMREVCESEWYQGALHPDWSFLRTQEAKGYYVNTGAGSRVSRTVGASIIGFKADVGIVDDPISAQSAYGDRAELRNHTRWFDEAFMTRLIAPDSPVCVVMQRLHERDLAGHLLNQGGWTHLCLPAEYDGRPAATEIGWSDPRSESGELLFPHLYPAERLDEHKKRGRRYYDTQFQQLPSPAEGTLFREKWLKYYTTAPRCDYYVGSWDFAWKKSRQSDYVVGQVWGVRGADRYLIAQVRKRMDPPDMRAGMLDMYRNHPQLRAMLVEAKAKGPQLVKSLRHDIPAIIDIDPRDTKEGRAAACTPLFEAGNVYFPHPSIAPWVHDDLIPEILSFPHGSSDDQVDAMTQALIWIREQETQYPWVFNA